MVVEENLSRKPSTCRVSLPFIFLILTLTCLNSLPVNAEASSSNPVKIRVDRLVQIEIDGAVVITDIVKLSLNGNTNVEPLSNLVIGLPRAYQGDLFHYFAYNAVSRLHVTPNLDMDGFYGVEVQFRESIDLAKTGSYNFTVVYVLTGLVSLDGEEYNVSFPLYPVLEKEVSFYNVTVILPPRTLYVNSSSYFDNATITMPQYSYMVLNRTESNVKPFTNQTSWITFAHSGYPQEFFPIELNQVVREITLDPWGNLIVSDFYQITNKGESLSTITLYIPRNATEISAQDVYGSIGVSVKDEVAAYKGVSVSLREALANDKKVKLTLNYMLPYGMYTKQNSIEDYTLTLDFLNFIHYIARKLIVKVILPEGADYQGKIHEYDNVTKFHDLNFNLNYQYNIFWASFRPVSWVGISSAVFCAILFLRVTVKPAKPAVIVTPIPLEILRRFVDAYEEKMRIALELKSMERRVRSGKLSKRKHRLRRISLDNRLSRLQKELIDLRSKIEAVGGRYSDMMKQLEIAEADLETLEGDIQRVEARYYRKELSAEAHRRLLDEYNRRREKAENRISEVILRLRENLQ